mmetsp:Transcript_16540/g.26863  ORF Transcript_16540/g.26863 Transcript_16540/m.26863 type:complete len:150 (+) Transcript_16540:904-1353(+)
MWLVVTCLVLFAVLSVMVLGLWAKQKTFPSQGVNEPRKLRLSSDVHGSQAALANPPSMSGVLCKRRKYLPLWPQRYFVLHDSLLYYYLQKADHYPRGVILVDPSYCHRDGRVITIVDNKSSDITYRLYGLTDKETNEWFHAFQNIKKTT